MEIAKLGQSLQDAQEALHSLPGRIYKHVNNAMVPLTPFPPRHTCLPGSNSEVVLYIFPKEKKEGMCVTPPLSSGPSALAAAAVETLKCNVCISSQLLKSLPLSPSVPRLSLSIHG